MKQSLGEYEAEAQDAYLAQPAIRTPLLLFFNGEAVGIATLDDLGDGRAAIRSIAIDETHQGAGHGRALLHLIETFARTRNISRLCVNADAEKTGFYERLGYSAFEWGSVELEDCRAGRAWPMPVQMIKPL